MPNPSWLTVMFERYELGELQSGIEFAAPIRREVSGKERPYEIVLDSVKCKGSRIPASTLAKFRSGEWTPRSRSLEKLKALNDRFNYNRLRSSGANREEARRMYRQKDVERKIADYRRYTKAISKGKGVDLAAVLWGMRHSENSYSFWQEYLVDGGSAAAESVMSDPEEQFQDDYWEQWLTDDDTATDDFE